MPSENEYTALIAGAHFEKPKFTQWVYELTEILAEARRRLKKMVADFDLDHAVGDQLDAIGVRVGITRQLPVTLTGIYFAFDDVNGKGFDFGIWKGRYDSGTATTVLDDETYRQVIRAKIMMNHFSGKNEDLFAFVDSIAESFGIDPALFFVRDTQDMNVQVGMNQADVPPVVWELLTRRIIDVIAAGVGMNFISNVTYFGLDMETAVVGGCDQGEWYPFS